MEPGFPEFLLGLILKRIFSSETDHSLHFQFEIKIKKKLLKWTVIFGSCTHLFLVLTFSSSILLRLYSFHPDLELSPAATDNHLWAFQWGWLWPLIFWLLDGVATTLNYINPVKFPFLEWWKPRSNLYVEQSQSDLGSCTGKSKWMKKMVQTLNHNTLWLIS